MAARSRRILTVPELVAYSEEHVYYEFKMFFGSAFYWNFEIDDEGVNWVLHMARIESFVIHLRNCIDFFYPGKLYDTDVIAPDFFHPGKPTPFPVITPILAAARIRANKELSHLTSERISGGGQDKRWDVEELVRQIHGLLATFLNVADPQKVHPQLRTLI